MYTFLPRLKASLSKRSSQVLHRFVSGDVTKIRNVSYMLLLLRKISPEIPIDFLYYSSEYFRYVFAICEIRDSAVV